MLNLRLAAIASALIVITPAAFAQGSFTLHLPLLDYSDMSTDTKAEGADSVKSKRTELTTAHRDNAFLGITIESWILYVYPLADTKVISGSRMFGENVEVGIDLGLNNFKTDKPKNNQSTDIYGLFAGYLTPLAEKFGGEFYVFYSHTAIKGTDETPSGATPSKVKTNIAEDTMKVTAEGTVALSKNVTYVGGISYKTTTNDDKERKEKSTTSGFGLNIASVRISF